MVTQTQTRMRTQMYVVVRRTADDGREWIDNETFSCLYEHALTKAHRMDAVIPQWALANPVARVIRCDVTEQAQ